MESSDEKVVLSTEQQNRPRAIVTRDPTFQRAVADKVVAIDLGKDVELAFLQGGPVIKGLVDFDEETEHVELEGGLSEVSRIRVPGPIALALAVNIIETLTSAGKIKVPALKQALSHILESRQQEEEPRK